VRGGNVKGSTCFTTYEEKEGGGTRRSDMTCNLPGWREMKGGYQGARMVEKVEAPGKGDEGAGGEKVIRSTRAQTEEPKVGEQIVEKGRYAQTALNKGKGKGRSRL